MTYSKSNRGVFSKSHLHALKIIAKRSGNCFAFEHGAAGEFQGNSA